MTIQKKCKHGRGLAPAARRKAWRGCGCQWIASVTVDGIREYVNLGTDEKEAASAELRLRADNMDGRTLRRRPGKDFTMVADHYLAELKASLNAKPNGIRTTTSRLERLKAYWGDTPVDGITLEHVRLFIDDAKGRYAPNTAIALYSTFRGVMSHAQDYGLVTALPLPAKSRIPKVNKRKANHLTVAEAAKVIEKLPAPYASMAELALLTGLRVGEIAALEHGDFDRERGVLHVQGTLAHNGTVGPPKTSHSRRAVPLSPGAAAILANQPTTEGRIFPTPSLAMCGHVMRDTLKAVKLHRPGRGWHAFRHAHEALLEASGLGIRDAAARMGHGPNFIQTAAYGWAAEAGDPADVDATRARLHRASSKHEAG